jgi:hypothetical protein
MTTATIKPVTIAFTRNTPSLTLELSIECYIPTYQRSTLKQSLAVTNYVIDWNLDSDLKGFFLIKKVFLSKGRDV